MKNIAVISFALLIQSPVCFAEYKPFTGTKLTHDGMACYEVDVGAQVKATVIVPSRPAEGCPWVMVPSMYSTNNPVLKNVATVQASLVRSGYHVVVMAPSVPMGAPDPQAHWDKAYQVMTQKHGLSEGIVLIAVSREALTALCWAAEHPGKVWAAYLDKGVCDVGLAQKLADDRVGIVYVAGEKDEVVPFSKNGAPMQKVFDSRSAFFRVFTNKKEGHEPHGMENPSEILRFINMNVYRVKPTKMNVAYGDNPSQVLDFYQAKSDKPTPVVVSIHGGGWNAGSRRGVGNVQDYLNAGISVVAVGYRFIAQANAEGVEPPVKAPVTDAARAVQFVRSKASEWNLSKERIGLTGGSAGACSSLWIAFHPDLADPSSPDPVKRESTRPYCAAVSVPQTSLDPKQMREWIPNSSYGTHAFSIPKDEARRIASFNDFIAKREKLLPWIAEYSPYALAKAGAPAIYMYYGEKPDMGKNQKDATHSANFGVKLQERLQELNVPCELVYPGAPNVKHDTISNYLIDVLKAP